MNRSDWVMEAAKEYRTLTGNSPMMNNYAFTSWVVKRLLNRLYLMGESISTQEPVGLLHSEAHRGECNS